MDRSNHTDYTVLDSAEDLQCGLAAEAPCNVTPQPGGGVVTLLSRMPHHFPGKYLLSLHVRQRKLLTLCRDFVQYQLSWDGYIGHVCGHIEKGLTRPSDLRALCTELQQVSRCRVRLQNRLRGENCLYPVWPLLHDTARNMQGRLLLMSVKAVTVTEELIVTILRRVAHCPSDVTGDLCRSLTVYNQVLADLSLQAGRRVGLQPFCGGRAVEILARERGLSLAVRTCLTLSCGGLEETPESDDVNAASFSQHLITVYSENRNPLETLLRDDRNQVTPAIHMLTGSDSALYTQYCAHLWPVMCARIFYAFYPGVRGHWALLGLTTGAEEAHGPAVRALCDLLTSGGLPDPCRVLTQSLCERLTSTAICITWDHAFCNALSSALTDKCVAPAAVNQGPATHSRTATFLEEMCRQLSQLLQHVDSSDPGAVSAQQGVLARCVFSLDLCVLWLRGRSQTYTYSGSLRPLVLVAYGDLALLQRCVRSLVASVRDARWLPVTQGLYVKLQDVSDVLEGLVMSLPHLVASVCTQRAQDVFRNLMPTGRYWRGKMEAGHELVPSQYAQAAVRMVVVPVLDGVRDLCLDEQVSAVSLALSVFMEAWMGHILREKMRFSLQGALQLKRDFETVRELLRSREGDMSPEVIQEVLSLPAFLQADNAVVCLLQQPSRKAYMQSHSCLTCCPPLCRAAVESVSDSLQSLESLERRVWGQGYSARRPRHSHDSYLPHNQRPWLSLRVHKGWSGFSLPWEG